MWGFWMDGIIKAMGEESFANTRFRVLLDGKLLDASACASRPTIRRKPPMQACMSGVFAVQSLTDDGPVTWYPPIIWAAGAPPLDDLRPDVDIRIPHSRRWIAIPPLALPDTFRFTGTGEWLVRTYNPLMRCWVGPSPTGVDIRRGGLVELTVFCNQVRHLLTIEGQRTSLIVSCGYDTSYSVELEAGIGNEVERGVKS